MIIKFKKINGDLITARIPDGWEEVTVKQFIALEAKETNLEILSAFTGEDLSFLENTATDLTPALYRIVEVFNEKPDFNNLPKETLHINGHKIPFPESIDFILMGQKEMIKALVQKNETIEKTIAECFAIYAQPFIDGSFKASRIEAVKEEILRLPILKVFPHFLFFFKELGHMRKDLMILLNLSR